MPTATYMGAVMALDLPARMIVFPLADTLISVFQAVTQQKSFPTIVLGYPTESQTIHYYLKHQLLENIH